MAKFATKSKSTKIVNVAGGEAYKQTDKLSLVSILLTSFLKDQYYKSGKETMDTLIDAIKNLPDKKFVAQAALYARNEFGMRSVSHVAAGEIAKTVHGETWTKNFFKKIVHRPDDMMEILAYLYASGMKTEPNALKKGFAAALETMNKYSLAKYRYEGKEVSLVDVVNLVHPKSTEAIAALMKGEIKNTQTWESKLSAAGGDKAAKTEAWRDLILENKLGYMALLRNLRNILEQAPDMIDKACELLIQEEKIKKSLVLPFRFITAIKEIQQCNFDGTRKVLVALNRALDISTANVPKFPGKTLVVLDSSGSMSGQPAEIGALFSAILYKSNDADFMTFSDNAQYRTLNAADSTLTIAQSIPFVSGGTNFHSIFQEANKKYDRVIILSDMQGWVGYNTPEVSFNAYKRRFAASPFIYSFDLTGHGDMQFPENQVACLAGFSEKIFDIMTLCEQDKQALIHKIESIEI